jgi:hypothetical protein
MSRVLNLTMTERETLDYCDGRGVGVSAIEALPSGGVRLVCMSVEGAERARKALKSKLINGDVTRTRFRPTKPLW